jgi:hypothetical protein
MSSDSAGAGSSGAPAPAAAPPAAGGRGKKAKSDDQQLLAQLMNKLRMCSSFLVHCGRVKLRKEPGQQHPSLSPTATLTAHAANSDSVTVV